MLNFLCTIHYIILINLLITEYVFKKTIMYRRARISNYMVKLLSKNHIDLSGHHSKESAFSKIDKLINSQVFNDSSISIDICDTPFAEEDLSKIKWLLGEKHISLENILTNLEETKKAAEKLNLKVDFIEKKEPQSSDTNEDDVVEEIKIAELTEDSYIEVEKEEVEKEAEPTVSAVFNTASAKEAKTLFINQTLRSGQFVSYDGNVVIIGDSHPGSEIVATGDIIIWGELSGMAHAGAPNNIEASIKALKINALQLRIANCIARRPDSSNVMAQDLPLKPESAVIVNGDIRIISKKY